MNELNSGVVCFRVLKEFSFGLGSGFKYKCCERVEEDQRHQVYCGFDVKESIWLSVFNSVLNVVVTIVFFYGPYLFCVVPDFFSDGHRQDHVKNLTSKQSKIENEEETFLAILDEIPVDDSSPISCTEIVQKCVKNLPTLNYGFNVKLILLWYCIIPTFFFFKLLLYFIIKDNFDEASKKLLFQVADAYLYIFSMDKPAVYVLFIVPLFVIPTLVISFWRFEESLDLYLGECFICTDSGSDSQLSLKEHFVKRLKTMPNSVIKIMERVLEKLFLQKFGSKFPPCSECNHFQQSLCGHAICVLSTVAFMMIYGPIAITISLLIYLAVLLVTTIIYSPLVTGLIYLTKSMTSQIESIHKHRKKCKWLSNFLILIISIPFFVSVSIITIFSCQYIVRTSGLTLMGITLNAESAVPYITFAFVVWRNVYLCFNNLQNTYKEIKIMIWEEWKEQKKPKREGTIPKKLFWSICKDSVANEICAMLCKMVAILIFLSIALAAIFLFKVEYNSSTIVSSIAVFVSGKISEVFFSRVTTGNNITGWERVLEKQKIRDAVREFTPDMFDGERDVRMERDFSMVSPHESAV
ncbi:uncharacterized protein LOC111339126 [Stylophora pistillata]|uniref:uncharacterized protein LOC111339126 n=1 Tax=Stylophora pistillata TaxID=50429 RepID=UPI000C03C433|nr:uncharacterized protein LOC111339126 [Stylophora pistillata]